MWWLASLIRVPGWWLLVSGTVMWLGDGRGSSAGAAAIGLLMIAVGRHLKLRGIASGLDRHDRRVDAVARMRQR